MRYLSVLFLAAVSIPAALDARPKYSPQATYVSPWGGGPGLAATFTITVNIPLGISDFETLFFSFRPGLSIVLPFTNGCDLSYNSNAPYTFSLNLLNDQNTGVPQFALDGGTVINQSGQGVNSYCSLGGAPTHTVSGTTLTFTVPLIFNLGPTSGPMALFTDGIGYTGGESGFTVFASPVWTVGPPPPPSVSLLAPALPGSGSAGTFTVTATDAAGASDIGAIVAYIGNCGLLSMSGYVYIINDDWTAWNTSTNIPIGSSGVLENSWCVVQGLSTLVTQTAIAKSFTFQALFKPAFAGAHSVGGQAFNAAWAYTTNTFGTWNVVAPQTISTFTSLGGDSAPMVYDDYSGNMVQLPNSSDGRIPEVYITQPTTTGQTPLAIGAAYTVVIAGAPPNSNVWARSTSEEIPNSQTGTYDSWNPASIITVPNSGAALVGFTDSTGYFSRNWRTAAIPGSTSTGFWVGGSTAADPIYPPGVASTVDDSSFCGQVWFYVENLDGSTGPDFTPDAARRVRLRGGKVVSLSASPRVKVKKHPSSTFERDPAGVYTYKFSLDTRDTSGKMIRVNDDLGLSLGPTFEDAGNGWYALGEGWMVGDKPERGPDVHFSLRSRWKPGPVEIFWHGDPTAIPMQANSVENVIVSRATSMTRDSTSEVAIGPAINPEISEAELRLLVRSWKDVMGLSFLAPLLDSSDFAAGVELLKPSNEFERSVVACLRDVF